MLRVKPYLLDEFIPCALPSGNACRQNEEKGEERKCTQGGQYLLRFTVRQMFFRLCYRVRISGCGGVGLRGIHSGAGGGEVRGNVFSGRGNRGILSVCFNRKRKPDFDRCDEK